MFYFKSSLGLFFFLTVWTAGYAAEKTPNEARTRLEHLFHQHLEEKKASAHFASDPIGCVKETLQVAREILHIRKLPGFDRVHPDFLMKMTKGLGGRLDLISESQHAESSNGQRKHAMIWRALLLAKMGVGHIKEEWRSKYPEVVQGRWLYLQCAWDLFEMLKHMYGARDGNICLWQAELLLHAKYALTPNGMTRTEAIEAARTLLDAVGEQYLSIKGKPRQHRGGHARSIVEPGSRGGPDHPQDFRNSGMRELYKNLRILLQAALAPKHVIEAGSMHVASSTCELPQKHSYVSGVEEVEAEATESVVAKRKKVSDEKKPQSSSASAAKADICAYINALPAPMGLQEIRLALSAQLQPEGYEFEESAFNRFTLRWRKEYVETKGQSGINPGQVVLPPQFSMSLEDRQAVH